MHTDPHPLRFVAGPLAGPAGPADPGRPALAGPAAPRRPAPDTAGARLTRLADRIAIAFHAATTRVRPTTANYQAALTGLTARLVARLSEGRGAAADRLLDALDRLAAHLHDDPAPAAVAAAAEPGLAQATGTLDLEHLVAARATLGGEHEPGAMRDIARQALDRRIDGRCRQLMDGLPADTRPALSPAAKSALRQSAPAGGPAATPDERMRALDLLLPPAGNRPATPPDSLALLQDLGRRGALPLNDVRSNDLPQALACLAAAGVAGAAEAVLLERARLADRQAWDGATGQALQALARRELADGVHQLAGALRTVGAPTVLGQLAHLATSGLEQAVTGRLRTLLEGADGAALDAALTRLLRRNSGASPHQRTEVAAIRAQLRALRVQLAAAGVAHAPLGAPGLWGHTPMAVSQAVHRIWGLSLTRQDPELVNDIETQAEAGMMATLEAANKRIKPANQPGDGKASASTGGLPPARETQFAAQSMKDWPRNWVIDAHVPGRPTQRLRFTDRDALGGRVTVTVTEAGRPPREIDLKGLRDPIGTLAADLGVDPVRLWRVSQVMSQAEFASTEMALFTSPRIFRIAGGKPGRGVNPPPQDKKAAPPTAAPAKWPHRVNLSGGEAVRCDLHFEEAADRLAIEFSRGRLNDVMVDLVPLEGRLDADRSFMRMNYAVRIDGVGQLSVIPGHTSIDCAIARRPTGTRRTEPPRVTSHGTSFETPAAAGEATGPALEATPPAPQIAWPATGSGTPPEPASQPGPRRATAPPTRRAPGPNPIGDWLERIAAARHGPAREEPGPPLAPPPPPGLTANTPRRPSEPDILLPGQFPDE